MRALRNRLTYANVVATLALVIAVAGGTAYAANTVFSSDIVNDQVYSADVRNDTLSGGGLTAADLRNGAVGNTEIADGGVRTAEVQNESLTGADIKNGEVSVLDTNKVIPSGATVTGAFREQEENSDPGNLVRLLFSVDFHGLRAPTPLTDADINFDDTGISAAAAAPGEDSSGCTGGIGIPTAPPGKVCIYLFEESVVDGSARGITLGSGTGFTEPNDKGFTVFATNLNAAGLGGTWAYRAP